VRTHSRRSFTLLLGAFHQPSKRLVSIDKLNIPALKLVISPVEHLTHLGQFTEVGRHRILNQLIRRPASLNHPSVNLRFQLGIAEMQFHLPRLGTAPASVKILSPRALFAQPDDSAPSAGTAAPRISYGNYNRPIVVRPFRSSIRLLLLVALLLAAFAVSPSRAQSPTSADSAADIRQPGGRLVLVLPFENRSGQANLNWIGDSFPYTLDQRLASVGFLPIGRDDRQYALEHLGLPRDFRPSRATTIRIAQTLDADFVIVGSFNVQNGRIQVQAQVLEVNQLRMSPPLTDSAELSRLFDVENAIAWKLAQRMDPHFAVAEQTFLAAAGGVTLSSFEDYIRGTSAPTADERLQRLQSAVASTPNYTAALLALGKEQYAASQFEEAAATLAKVPPNDRVALEAGFYRGLARFNIAKYSEAESAFAFVATRLPLPEVVNNEAVAESRQGKDAVPLFQQVVAADPNDADYHFNLAVALLGHSDIVGATREVQTAVKLHPDDFESTELLTRLQSTNGSTTNLKSILSSGGFDPTTRIRRTWSEASFRQVAFQLDQMRAIQMSTLPPAKQAVEYTQLGTGYLAQGLIPEAEQEFQSALSADPRNAAAHAGLAQVRERSASPDAARTEARTSLTLTPNVDAYLVLARLDLQSNQLAAAASDVSNALRLEPNNSAVLAMKYALATRNQPLP
jgi:tetratricopeptide (TPR) repeat protein